VVDECTWAVKCIQFGTDALLAQSSDRELSQELLEGLFSRSVGGHNGFIEDR